MTSKDLKPYQKKSIPDLIKLASKHFNAYIRARDLQGDYFTCISCAKVKHKEMMHAGHYLSAGHNGAVRFDERNVHGQCSACNTHLSGNLLGYTKGLIQKIGTEAINQIELKSKMRGFKWDRYSLIETIITYRDKLKNHVLEKSNSNTGIPHYSGNTGSIQPRRGQLFGGNTKV